MTTVSLHLNNTLTGEYDPKKPLPKPLHCDPETGMITRKQPFSTVDQVIGFTDKPIPGHITVLWGEFDQTDPEQVLGMLPVVIDDGQISTMLSPIDKVVLNLPGVTVTCQEAKHA